MEDRVVCLNGFRPRRRVFGFVSEVLERCDAVLCVNRYEVVIEERWDITRLAESVERVAVFLDSEHAGGCGVEGDGGSGSVIAAGEGRGEYGWINLDMVAVIFLCSTTLKCIY